MRRFSVCLSLLLLAGCGGSSSGGDAAACDQSYWDGTFGTCLPEGWHVVDVADLQGRGAPREVVAAFQAETAAAGRFPLVTVTEQPLAGDIGAEEFDAQSREAVTTLPGYALIDDETVAIDGNDITLHVFSAQPIGDQPVQRFYQLSVAGKQKGYTFTGVLPISADKEAEARLTTLLKNVTLSDPEKAKEE